MRKDLIALIIGLLAYSIMSFAYMHNTFSSKEIMSMSNDNFRAVLTRIDNNVQHIDNKVDKSLVIIYLKKITNIN